MSKCSVSLVSKQSLKNSLVDLNIVRETLSADLIDRLILDILETTEALMSTSPPPSLKNDSAKKLFISPSNFRSLPSSPSKNSSQAQISSFVYTTRFYNAVATTLLHLAHFLISFFSLISLTDTHGTFANAIPQGSRLSSLLPFSRFIKHGSTHLPDSSTIIPNLSEKETVTDSRKSSPAESDNAAMMVVATSNVGVHQPDHGHGRPDQANFADGHKEPEGQNTYAKQC